MQKRRGRPQKYDVDRALDGAMQVFWLKGVSATSMDDLIHAMGMNKPSIYNAFGDKRVIYKKVVARFAAQTIEQIDQILTNETDLKKALLKFYEGGLDVYFATPEHLSCFITNTVPVESAKHADIQELLASTIHGMDNIIEKRLLTAQQKGWALNRDIAHLAKLFHGVLQSIALRARGGEPRSVLEQFAEQTVNLIVDTLVPVEG
jgi:AcrR family transcriptional regulator